ncbi:hypothetical protein Tco_1016727 [Tanacetum coccineum]|uniref:Auxilin-like protein n=1 Tax=Tanacetum coccineum TaxID=301880 RepID=A0ABQ5FRE8_9ASTR
MVFECLRALHAQDFLLAIPIDGLGQHMSPVKYRTILNFTNKDTAPSKAQQTLASALFSEMVKDMKAHFDMTVRQKTVFECLRALHAQDFLLAIPIDGLGQHMAPVKYRTILKRVGISAKKEAPVNFLTDPSDGRFTLRPDDVLIFGWAGGKHTYVDLTGVSPLVGLSYSRSGCFESRLMQSDKTRESLH